MYSLLSPCLHHTVCYVAGYSSLQFVGGAALELYVPYYSGLYYTMLGMLIKYRPYNIYSASIRASLFHLQFLIPPAIMKVEETRGGKGTMAQG